jgi:Cu/Ag efflux protein CusF
MVSKGVRLTLVSLVLFGLASAGFAQVAEIKGTVQRVDAPNGMIYFTDGRTMRLEPGTRLYVGNREVRLADVQPGWVLSTSPATVAPGTIVVQPSAPPPVAVSPAPRAVAPAGPSVDATGVVASVDSRTGMITLQDGRIVRVTPGTTVWQPVTIGSVMPGASVFVRNAEPLDFRPATMPAASQPWRMGTVTSVDSATSRVILSDGTIVQLRPGTQATFDGRTLAITELRPGDEIIVGVPASGSVVATGASAMPRQVVGVIEGSSIQVVRRPQSP